MNRKGEILLTKRHPDKPPAACYGEMTGVSVLAGETSREARPASCARSRVDCEPEALTYLGTVIKGHSITDLYRCDQEFEIEKLSAAAQRKSSAHAGLTGGSS